MEIRFSIETLLRDYILFIVYTKNLQCPIIFIEKTFDAMLEDVMFPDCTLKFLYSLNNA